MLPGLMECATDGLTGVRGEWDAVEREFETWFMMGVRCDLSMPVAGRLVVCVSHWVMCQFVRSGALPFGRG